MSNIKNYVSEVGFLMTENIKQKLQKTIDVYAFSYTLKNKYDKLI